MGSTGLAAGSANRNRIYRKRAVAALRARRPTQPAAGATATSRNCGRCKALTPPWCGRGARE